MSIDVTCNCCGAEIDVLGMPLQPDEAEAIRGAVAAPSPLDDESPPTSARFYALAEDFELRAQLLDQAELGAIEPRWARRNLEALLTLMAELEALLASGDVSAHEVEENEARLSATRRLMDRMRLSAGAVA